MLFTSSAIAQSTLYDFRGDGAPRFGASVSTGADLDGDGHSDILVGAPADFASGFYRVYSGRDGSVLLEGGGYQDRDLYGLSTAFCGDVDADGVPDLVIGAPGANDTGTIAGCVRVISGQTGAVLYEWFGGAAGDMFGFAVCGVGDLDGDGRPDIAIGAPFVDGPVWFAGALYVRSGGSGALLFTSYGNRRTAVSVCPSRLPVMWTATARRTSWSEPPGRVRTSTASYT